MRMATRDGGVVRLTAAVAVAAVVILAPAALASHDTAERVSFGPTGGNGNFDASADGVSADGTAVVFRTDEALTVEDGDTEEDLYVRDGGVTSLVSTGPDGGNGTGFFSNFVAISADGSRVHFTTDEMLTEDDDDAEEDIYERTGGTTTKVSTGQGVPDDGPFEGLSVEHVTADGAEVFFTTEEPLTTDDTDMSNDLFERSGGVTTKVSAGEGVAGNGAFAATFGGASADGARVFFNTNEALTLDDTDAQRDAYERAAGATTRISRGGTGDGTGGFPAGFAGASSDGTRVFFVTSEPLTASDTDAFNDIYERTGTTTTWISDGEGAAGNGAANTGLAGVSADGSRLFLITTEQFTPDDEDTQTDFYERSGGVITRLSRGPNGDGNGPFEPFQFRISQDGTRVFISTQEKWTADDTDSHYDTYERSGGVTTRISTGPLGGNGLQDTGFPAISADGTRAFFNTDERWTADDTENQVDVYERAGGVTTRISTGPAGGNGPFNAGLGGVSADGSVVFVDSDEALTADDADTADDVFAFTIGPSPPPPPPPPPPPTDKAARTLQLDASKRKVPKGKKVTLRGAMASANPACAANQEVSLERKRKGGPFKDFATATSAGDGSFSLKTPVRKTTTYRAELAENAACLGDLSNTEKVRAKKRR